MNAPTTALVLQPNIVTQVPVGMLCRDPDQPRIEIPPDSLTAMAADIAARGIEQPIVVRSDFVIKDGERRWRAAQLARLATVPCILAGPMTDKNNAVQWRLDQVADNHHREPLNALDWARVLRELVDVHQMAVKDIPNLLKARGIDMSRPYISNLIRLNDLPDWAKALIASGVLPPGAGKYVLMAIGHAPAIINLRHQIEADAKRLEPGQSLRAELNWQVRRAFVMTAIELSTSNGVNKPRFPWQTSCKTCTKRSQVDGDHFCLDRQCYGEKQAAADKAAKKPGHPKTTAPGRQKPDPKAAAQAKLHNLQREARNTARDRAIAIIAKKAEAGLSQQDRLLIARSLLEQTDVRPILESRGWPKPKNNSGFETDKVALRELVKLNAKALDAFILECVLQSDFFHVNAVAKRYRVDLKAMEKAALTELKPKKPTKEAKP